MTAPAAPAPPTRSFWDIVLIGVVPVSGLVAAIAAIIISYQISRISDLGSDIKNVNGRVDQIYPLIAQSTADIGFIKGSLEATSQKIAAASDKNDMLTKRLESLVAGQETQYETVKQLRSSVESVLSLMNGEQKQLDDIKNKINFDATKQGNFWFDAIIFASLDISTYIANANTGAKIFPVDWSDTGATQKFFRLLGDSHVDFNKIVMTTRDDGTSSKILEAFKEAGFKLGTEIKQPSNR